MNEPKNPEPAVAVQPFVRRFHTIPLDDDEIHEAQTTCWCHPTQTEPNLWVHHAKDCREAIERQGKPTGKPWTNIAETVADVRFTFKEAVEIEKSLSAAMDDIRQLIRVAKYNLTGEYLPGDVIEKPNPPVLVHEAGIAASEAVIGRCNAIWRVVYGRIKTNVSGQQRLTEPATTERNPENE